MPKTNASVELYYDGVWNAAPAYTRDAIQATWGLASEGAGIRPATCATTLDNTGGDYNPSDARSDLYGLIGRNTPGRVALAPGLTTGSWADTTDTFTRTSVNSWGSATSGQAWTTYGNGGTVNASDWQVGSGVGTLSVPIANALRMSYLSSLNVVDFTTVVTMKAPQATGASLEIGGIAYRGTSTTVYQHLQVRATTTNTVTIRAFSNNATQLGLATVAGLTHAGTGTPLRLRVTVMGTRVMARVWVASTSEPTDHWDLEATNTLDLVAPGYIGLRASRLVGNTNVSPVVFTFDDWATTTSAPICMGDVSKWAPDRAVKGDAWTGLEITGPAQRVNGSGRTLPSRPLTYIPDNDPDAYWSFTAGRAGEIGDLTDGSGGNFVSTTSATAGSVEAGTADVAPWLDPLATLKGTSSVQADVTMDVVPVALTIDWVRKADLGGPGTLQLVFVGNGASPLSWTIDFLAGGLNEVDVTPTRPDGTHTGLTADVVTAPFSSDLTMMRFQAFQNAGNVDFALYVNGSLSSTISHTLNTATLTGLSQIRVNHNGASADSMAFGHLAVYQVGPSWAEAYSATLGDPGETAGARFLRLGEELGITVLLDGDEDTTAPMGPQYPDTLANTLTELASTDNALIYDAIGANALVMTAGRSRYNRTAALELTFNDNVAPPLRPVIDTLGTVNDVEAVRHSGGKYTQAVTSGPLNNSDPFTDPEGIGPRQLRLSVNPELDADLPDLAGWALHVGTNPGARYENVTVDLTARPELYVSALLVRPGDLITIEDLEPDLVELQVIGGQYVAENNHLLVTFNCVPAAPYRVGQVETSSYMRIGSSSSTLAADFIAGTNTSMSVTVTGSLWSTTAEPYQIQVGGVVFNVTATTGAASPQTFTVDITPVNGVTRTIPAGSRIDIYPPIYIAL